MLVGVYVSNWVLDFDGEFQSVQGQVIKQRLELLKQGWKASDKLNV